MGDGQTLSLRLQATQFYNAYSFSFIEPWLGGRQPFQFSTSFSHTTQYRYDYFTGRADKSQYMQISGMSIGLAKRLRVPDDYFTLSQVIQFQYFDLKNYFTGLFTFGDGKANNLNYTIALSRNTTFTNPIFPVGGSTFTLSGKFTLPYSLITGEDFSDLASNPFYQLPNGEPDVQKIDQAKFSWLEFYKIKFNGTWYTRIIDKLILKTQTDFGFLGAYNTDRGNIPFERFYVGGDGMNQTFAMDGREVIALRGYPNQSLSTRDGSLLYNKFTAELRYPITLKPSASIFALTFLESGNGYNSFRNFNPFESKRSAGMGIRIFMPAFGNFYKFIFTFLLLISAFNQSFSDEVNVYTSRHYDSDNAIYEDFTNSTGIKVNIISGKGKALMERLRLEGKNSPADLFITSDAGNLWKIQKDGMFRKILSEKIIGTVPDNARGPNNEWVGIAKRSRVVFYNPNKVKESEIKDLTYEDLASPKWKGRLVVRSSGNIYNQSLVASLISSIGIEKTEKWAEGLVKNFARKPQGNDRSQIIAVANGQADIAIANTYYIGLMLSGEKGIDQKKAAEKVAIIFPGQSDRGTHINISGVGILKNAPNPSNAEKFIEYLLTDRIQKHIVENTYEYSIKKNIMPSDVIAQFGVDFKTDETFASEFGKYNSEAVRLMDRVGWR